MIWTVARAAAPPSSRDRRTMHALCERLLRALRAGEPLVDGWGQDEGHGALPGTRSHTCFSLLCIMENCEIWRNLRAFLLATQCLGGRITRQHKESSLSRRLMKAEANVACALRHTIARIVTGEVRSSGGVPRKRDGVDRATPTSVAKPLRPCAFARAFGLRGLRALGLYGFRVLGL